MRTLIIGDLHGTMPNIRYKNFDSIVAVGDFCSWSDEARNIYNISYRELLKDPYNYREWWEICGKKEAKRIVENSLKDGRNILEFLNSLEVPIYTVPGNIDWAKPPETRLVSKWDYLNQDLFNDYLIKGLDNLINLDRRIKETKDYVFVGYGRCNGPELFKYRDYETIFKQEDIEKNKRTYKKLLQNYHQLFQKATSKEKPIIFLSHNVPFNTSLDEITNEDSPRYGYHYGSLIVREMIEKYQPIVNPAGHMHEHFDKCEIGKTTCINAGYGANANVWLELEENKIKKLKFYRK